MLKILRFCLFTFYIGCLIGGDKTDTNKLFNELTHSPLEIKVDLQHPIDASLDENEIDTEAEKQQSIGLATQNYESTFLQTLLVFIGLILFIALTIWAFKRIGYNRIKTMNTLKSVKILEKRPISPKTVLYLIEVGGKQVLISESHLDVKKITSLNYLKTDDEL